MGVVEELAILAVEEGLIIKWRVLGVLRTSMDEFVLIIVYVGMEPTLIDGFNKFSQKFGILVDLIGGAVGRLY
jgi:hypothetical protein